MAKNTKTATIASGISTSPAPLSTLLGTSQASKEEHYEDVELVNTGTVDLLVYAMQRAGTPTSADAKTISAGKTQYFARLDPALFYVSLISPLTGPDTTRLEFTGTPADR